MTITASNIIKLQPWAETHTPAARSLSPIPSRRQRYFLLDLHVAGFRHHDGLERWGNLKRNAPVQLRRESGNAFDQHAISVIYDSQKIGYVPRSHSELLARMIDHGRFLSARISRIEDPEDAWEPIHLNVFVANRRLPIAGQA